MVIISQLVEEVIEDGEDLPAGQTATAIDQSPIATDFAAKSNGASTAGALTVTVLDVKDLAEECKAHVAVTIGSKTHKTGHSHKKAQALDWDEPLKFQIAAGDSTASVSLMEHKTLGKDRLIGSAEVDIWRHISAAAPAADVTAEVRPMTRLSFQDAGVDPSVTTLSLYSFKAVRASCVCDSSSGPEQPRHCRPPRSRTSR